MRIHHQLRSLRVEPLDPRVFPSTLFASDAILIPNQANQEVIIGASGDMMVRGVNLRIALGDGRGAVAEPKITAVEYVDTIWADHPRQVVGGPIEGEPQFAQSTLVLTTRDLSVQANGVVARLKVDTTDFFAGEFAFKITDNEFGVPSDFAGRAATRVDNGTIRIAGPGDANLDGIFNSTDLIDIFQIGEYEDNVSSNSTWTDGDWNQDNDFDSGDMLLAFQQGVFVRDA